MNSTLMFWLESRKRGNREHKSARIIAREREREETGMVPAAGA